jgi:hypothetical protein
MFTEAFTKLELDEIADILDRVNNQVEGSIFDPLETTILSVNVPYYAGYRYLDISDHATKPPLQRSVLQKGDSFVILNWSYKPIYELNELAPIALDEKNILDYVRFFFGHVKGRHGKFRICENLDVFEWKDEPSLDIRKSVGSWVTPMKLIEKSNAGIYKIAAIMLLKDTLFKVDVYVESNGRVTLSDHEILLEEVPVLDEVFSQ